MSDHNQEPNIYHDWEVRLRPEMATPQPKAKPDPEPKTKPDPKPKPPLESLSTAKE